MDNLLVINGTLYPKDVSIPTHIDTYGIGGMRVVDTYDDMTEIPTSFKKDGMLVNVSTEDTLYRWVETSGTWEVFKITEDMIEDNSIDGKKIIDNSIPPDKLMQESIDGTKLKYGSVTTDKIASRAIKGVHIAQNTITSNQLSYACITTDAIAPKTITGDKLMDDSIDGANIMNDSINGSKIESGSLTPEKLGEGVSLMARCLSTTTIDVTATDKYTHTVDLSDYFDNNMKGRCIVYIRLIFISPYSSFTSSSNYFRANCTIDDEYSAVECGGTTGCKLTYESVSGIDGTDNTQTIIIGETNSSSEITFSYWTDISGGLLLSILPIAYIPLEGTTDST